MDSSPLLPSSSLSSSSTQGTITDDSDVFLFGGERVYRHFFSQNKSVESYNSKDIEIRLGEEGGKRWEGEKGGRGGREKKEEEERWEEARGGERERERGRNERRKSEGRRGWEGEKNVHTLTATLIHTLTPSQA